MAAEKPPSDDSKKSDKPKPPPPEGGAKIPPIRATAKGTSQRPEEAQAARETFVQSEKTGPGENITIVKNSEDTLDIDIEDENSESSSSPQDHNIKPESAEVNITTSEPDVHVSKDGSDVLNPSSPSFWILQSLPDNFDPRTEIQPGNSTTWGIYQYQNLVKVGDYAFFWLGQVNQGLYGWGKVSSDPTRDSEDEKKYNFDVTFESKFLFPLPRQLVQSIIGEDNRLFSFRNGSIFELD